MPDIDTSGLSSDEAAQLQALLAKQAGSSTGSAPAPQADDDYEPPADAPWIKSKAEAEAAKADAAAARAARLESMGVPVPDAAPAATEGVIVEDADGVSLFDPEDGADDLDSLLADEAAPPAPEVDPAEALLQKKLEMIQALMPDFDWDLKLQWRQRVKLACTQFGNNKTYLNAIKQIETPTVVKYITEFEVKQAQG